MMNNCSSCLLDNFVPGKAIGELPTGNSKLVSEFLTNEATSVVNKSLDGCAYHG